MPKGDEVMEVRKLKTVIAGCGKIFFLAGTVYG